MVELPCAFAHESNADLLVKVSPPHDSRPAVVCVGWPAGAEAGVEGAGVGVGAAAGPVALAPVSPGTGSSGPKLDPTGVDKSCDVNASSDDVFADSESNIACDILSAAVPLPPDTVSAPEPASAGVAVVLAVVDAVLVCSLVYSRYAPRMTAAHAHTGSGPTFAERRDASPRFDGCGLACGATGHLFPQQLAAQLGE